MMEVGVEEEEDGECDGGREGKREDECDCSRDRD